MEGSRGRPKNKRIIRGAEGMWSLRENGDG